MYETNQRRHVIRIPAVRCDSSSNDFMPKTRMINVWHRCEGEATMFVPPVNMDVTLPSLEMQTTLPRVTIDAQHAHSDIGLKPMGPLMREQAARAQAAGTEAIDRIAREGDRLAQVEVSANAIAEIAAEKWPTQRELNVDSAPKHRPQLHVQEGSVLVRIHPGRVRVQLPHLTGSGNHIDLFA